MRFCTPERNAFAFFEFNAVFADADNCLPFQDNNMFFACMGSGFAWKRNLKDGWLNPALFKSAAENVERRCIVEARSLFLTGLGRVG